MSVRGDVYDRFAARFRVHPILGAWLQEHLVFALQSDRPSSLVLSIDGTEGDDNEIESFQSIARTLPVKVTVIARTLPMLLDAAEVVESLLAEALADREIRDTGTPSFRAEGAESGGPVFSASWSIDVPYRVSAGDVTLEV